MTDKKDIILCVAGSRELSPCNLNQIAINVALSVWIKEHGRPSKIIHGGCSGVDEMAAVFAADEGIACEAYPAHWDAHGKAAGPIRNAAMACNATHLVAIPHGASKGTRNMISTFEDLRGIGAAHVLEWYQLEAKIMAGLNRTV